MVSGLPVRQQANKGECPGKCSMVTKPVFWKVKDREGGVQV